MSFSLPDLPYSYDALAPYMSRETLEYHHDKHHLAYVNNGNNLLRDTEWEGKSLEDIVKGSFGKNAGLFNNAGQHYNHLHFWKWMKPGGGGDKIPGGLEKKIVADLGSVAEMKEDFIQAGVTQFGSGWARSSAATSGSTPTTSITATGVPTTSRRFSITWSIGNTWLKWLSYDNRSATLEGRASNKRTASAQAKGPAAAGPNALQEPLTRYPDDSRRRQRHRQGRCHRWRSRGHA